MVITKNYIKKNKANRIDILLFAFALVILVSCNPQPIPENIGIIINKAGANGKELKQAIHHYQHPNDSLKPKALYMLINNMNNWNSYYGGNLDKFEPFFDNPTEDHNTEWMKYVTKYGRPDFATFEKIYDYEIITSDILINNIDMAFYTWQNFPWCKDFSYEMFCEYILPYRCGNEHLTNDWREILQEKFKWLSDSVKNNPSLTNAYTYLYKDINIWMISEFEQYPINISLENLLKFKDGRCHDETNMFMYACRAMGISVLSDHIPGWGKRKRANHRWHILVNERGEKLVMENHKLYPINFIPVNASYFTLDSIGNRHIPSNYQVLESKGITKVYRTTTSVFPEALSVKNRDEEIIPSYFNDPFMKDVTSEYIPCKNYSLSGINTDKKYTYLCVFNCYTWDAHSWSEIKGDSAIFKDIGFDAVYLPAIYANNSYNAIGYPFVIDSEGIIKHIIPDTIHKQKLTLNRKYPLFANNVNYANNMIGGRFEIANNRGFSDAKTVHSITTTPLFIQEFTINNADFRYLRYVAPSNKCVELAELSVESFSEEGYEHITSTAISDIPGVEYNLVKSNANKIIDKNYVSYFVTKNKGAWAGLDLRKRIKSEALKVKYCPRNDDNFINPGYTYELRYWDNKWVTLDIKKAHNYWIEFDNVPKNSLYLLHCLNGGVEERIFTWENGKQVWW